MRAHVDDLTGAYRREVGCLALSHEIDRARRGDGRFVVVFVDLDGLKSINDLNGNAAGDAALKPWLVRCAPTCVPLIPSSATAATSSWPAWEESTSTTRGDDSKRSKRHCSETRRSGSASG